MTDQARARATAQRCFALAKSTTFPAERETAIKRGLAICERAGLDPDTFDIPGRERTGTLRFGGSEFEIKQFDFTMTVRRHRTTGFDFADQAETDDRYSRSRAEYDAAMARFRANVAGTWAEGYSQFGNRQAQARAGTDASGFDFADFESDTYQPGARAQQQARWPTIQGVIDFLFASGIQVYDMGEDADLRWFLPCRDSAQMDDEGLRDLADEVAGK